MGEDWEQRSLLLMTKEMVTFSSVVGNQVIYSCCGLSIPFSHVLGDHHWFIYSVLSGSSLPTFSLLLRLLQAGCEAVSQRLCFHLSVQHLMKHMNLLPLDSHGVDFSRVRMLNLNNWCRYYRQTLLFSALQDPQVNSVFNKHCFNYMGQVSSQRSWMLPFKCWPKGGERNTKRSAGKNSITQLRKDCLCANRFCYPSSSVSECPWCCTTISNAGPKAWRILSCRDTYLIFGYFVGSCFMSEIRFCFILNLAHTSYLGLFIYLTSFAVQWRVCLLPFSLLLFYKKHKALLLWKKQRK